MKTLYKPNSKNSGSALNLKINPTEGCVFLSMIKQSTWDERTKKGSFKGNVENPNATVNVKLSLLECAGIVDAIESNRRFSKYHSSPKQTIQLVIQPSIQGEGNEAQQVGFVLMLTKTPVGTKEGIKFRISFDWAEARRVKECLILAIQTEDLNQIKEQRLFEKNRANSLEQDTQDFSSAPETQSRRQPVEESADTPSSGDENPTEASEAQGEDIW